MADAADSKSARPFPDAEQSQGFTTLPEKRAATGAATGAATDPTRAHADPRDADDLDRIAAAWPDLPEPIRRAVLALIDAGGNR